jgi:hypothetical protein
MRTEWKKEERVEKILIEEFILLNKTLKFSSSVETHDTDLQKL